MFIINPLRGGAIAALFRSHPTTAARIARLRAMAGDGETTARIGPWT
jgi:heat shock protein HtpX